MLRPLRYDPTPEHRLTHAKWARGVGIVYGSVVLLLLGLMAAHSIFAEPNGATGTAKAPASPVAPQSAASRDAGVPAASIAPADTRTLVADPAIREAIGFAENVFDFTKPDGVPGFGPLRPSDDIDRLYTQAIGRSVDPRPDTQAKPDAVVGAKQ